MELKMDYNVKDVAQRLRGLREILGMSPEQVCEKTGVTPEEYSLIENGETDFSVTFIYKCAELFGVDIIEILTGDKPKLKRYSVVRKNTGLPVRRREGFEYRHLAYLFRDKKIEPFFVTAPYSEEEQEKPIAISVHEGQEFDYIISGSLKFSIDGKIKELSEGDAIIYDSGAPHGMIAANGEKCEFLAILIKKD